MDTAPDDAIMTKLQDRGRRGPQVELELSPETGDRHAPWPVSLTGHDEGKLGGEGRCFHKNSPRRGRKPSAYLEVTSSGTLHVPGFTVKESGLSVSPAFERGTLRHCRELQPNGAAAGQVAPNGASVASHRRRKNALLARAASNRQAHGGNPSEPRANTFSMSELIVFRRLGRGASGVVHLAIHPATLRLVAVKAVPVFDDDKRAQLVAELKALYAITGANRHVSRATGGQRSELSDAHSFVVALFDAVVDKKASTVNLVLEWMNGGSIQDQIDARGRLSESEIAAMLHCTLRGLATLHGSRQLHRDIKPANILVSRVTGLVKLSDFGIAHSFGTCSAANTFVGSLSFMAPERIESDEQGYSYPSDIWAVGLTVYVAATGEYPFEREYRQHGYWGLVHAISELPSPELGREHGPDGPELRDLVARCLRKDPSTRCTVKQALAHPFLSQAYPYLAVVGREFRGTARDNLAAVDSIASALRGEQTMSRSGVGLSGLLAAIRSVARGRGRGLEKWWSLAQISDMAEQLGVPVGGVLGLEAEALT